MTFFSQKKKKSNKLSKSYFRIEKFHNVVPQTIHTSFHIVRNLEREKSVKKQFSLQKFWELPNNSD